MDGLGPKAGSITGWLNELAYAPIDYSPQASVEAWSRDRGVGARYLSQQCVFRLALAAGIDLPVGVLKAEMSRAAKRAGIRLSWCGLDLARHWRLPRHNPEIRFRLRKPEIRVFFSPGGLCVRVWPMQISDHCNPGVLGV